MDAQPTVQASHPPSPELRASSFVRIGLAIYLLLIVYASLYPFSGWQHLGLMPWAFLRSPLPYYWTGFDVGTNIAAYCPLGLLAVLALHPYLRGVAAVLAAIALGTAVTGLMESIQTFLPSRVSSNLDLICNIAGTVLGACLGPLVARTLFRQNRLNDIRHRWFAPGASTGMSVVLLWPLAQIYPQEYLFGQGAILPILSDWLSPWLDAPLDVSAIFLHGEVLSVDQYWLAETIISACGLCGGGLTLLCLLKRHAPRYRLVAVLVALTLTTKALANALLFSPENALVWLTPGARGGLLIGALMLGGLALAPVVAQQRLAAVTLATSLLVINLIPANPYFAATLQTWVQGKFLNFNGAAQFLALCWPFAALWFLLHARPHGKAAGRLRGTSG